MSSFVASLNAWAERAMDFAWPMLWQSSLLIALIFALDWALRQKVRAAVRYALWLIVLVKLMLPPSLALPTSLAWWIRNADPVPAPTPLASSPARTAVVTYSDIPDSALPAQPLRVQPAPAAAPSVPVSGKVWLVGTWSGISLALFFWLGVRWRRASRHAHRAVPVASSGVQPDLDELFNETRRLAGMSGKVPYRLMDQPFSPAVCGLFRPVVLLPRTLVEQLAPAQLRSIVLHELIHLRRRDVWVNCLQAVLQIFYWWHPLLWLANARIRGLREEAVDDAVMLALAEDSDAYAPTLLEVARLAFRRPLTALGLVGILESRRGLRQRIERLTNFKTPGRAGLSVLSLSLIAALTALAVPMGEAPPKPAPATTAAAVNPPMEMTGDSQTFDSQTGVLRVDGNVTARSSNTTLTADSVEFNPSKNVLTARGNVTIQQDGVGLRANQVYSPAPGELQTTEPKPGDDMPAIVFTLAENGNYSIGTNSLSLADARSVFQMAQRLVQVKPGKLNFWIETSTSAPWQSVVDLMDLTRRMGFSDVRVRTSATNSTPAELEAIRSGVNDSFREHFGDADTAEFLLGIAGLKPHADSSTPGQSPTANSSANSEPKPQVSAAAASQARSGLGRQDLMKKLDQIWLEHVSFDHLPLTEVMGRLRDEIRKVDPENKSVNFIAAWIARPGSTTNTPPFDVGQVRITLKLERVRLSDVLNAVVKVADHPIQYSLEDYTVLFSQKDEGPKLVTRRFKFDPNAFREALQRFDPNAFAEFNESVPTNGVTFRVVTPRMEPGIGLIDHSPGTLLTRFFAAAGVDLDPAKGNSIFYKPRQGELLVRATSEDLNRIESVLGQLALAPVETAVPAISRSKPSADFDSTNLLVRKFKVDPKTFYQGLESVGSLSTNQNGMAEVTAAVQKYFQRLGVDLGPPKSVFFNDREGSLLVRATTPDLDIVESAVQTLNFAPPQINVKVRFVEVERGDSGNPISFYLGPLINSNSVAPGTGSSSSVSSNVPSPGLLGILTVPQYRAVLETIARQKTAKVICESEVTTLSDRQARIEVVDVKMVVTNTQLIATNIQSQASKRPGNRASSSNDRFHVVPQVAPMSFGPVLDVTPKVSADGYTIQMKVTASLLEFLGYDDAGAFSINGKRTEVPLLIPRTRIRQVTSEAIVWDGQTLVLRAGAPDSSPTNKNLLVFVTATIVDPTGKPAHPEEQDRANRK